MMLGRTSVRYRAVHGVALSTPWTAAASHTDASPTDEKQQVRHQTKALRACGFPLLGFPLGLSGGPLETWKAYGSGTCISYADSSSGQTTWRRRG